MYPQYLARQSSGSRLCEALRTQGDRIRATFYRFAQNYTILTRDCTQAVHTSKTKRGAGVCPAPLTISDRRIQCRTLSRASWPSAWSLQFPPASRRPKMITSLSSPSPSRWSPHRPASTASTNPTRRIVITGQAHRPAPNPRQILRAALAHIAFCQRPASEGMA